MRDSIPLMGISRSALDDGLAFNRDGLACGADPSTEPASAFPQMQDDLGLSGAIEARLADVVRRLRGDWIAGPGGRWPEICAIHADSLSDLEKRIATTLRQGFFEFGQLLCGFEVLLLQGKHSRLELEQAVLRLEKLVVDLANHRSELVEISDFLRSRRNLARDAQGGGDGR